MNNPYIFRGPVRSANMFFGRRHELAEIISFLHGNQSVSVVGPRKYGKTSLLFHLMRTEVWPQLGMDTNTLTVYLDCEVLGDGSHEDIFGQFANEMIAALEERGLPAEPALEATLQQPSRLSFERALRKLNQRGLRVVLILDEFERLSTNPSLDVNFFNALRSAAGRYQLAYVTASARPLIQLTYSEKSQEILSSPFFNIFAPLFLGQFPEEEARQIITQPSAAAGVPFPPNVEDYLFSLVGGYPLGLQVACFHAFDVLSGAPGTAGSSEISEIERRAVQELTPHWEYYWRNLSPAEQEILQRVPDAASLAPTDTTLRGILRDLVQKSLLITEGGAYKFPSRGWASFVATQSTAGPSSSKIGGTLTGLHLGPYEVLEPIGRGGMAEVYRGHHPRLDRTVAIKVLPAQLAAEADFRNRFEREARAVASLKHANIVQVFDFGDMDGMYYMVMEYIRGLDLAHYLKEQGPLTLDQARPIFMGLAGALDYAHAQGLVHRDVKPSNVLLEQHPDLTQPPTQIAGQPALLWRPVLTDFGIAKLYGGDTHATKTGMMMGTLDYMAPEQIRSSGEVDHLADVYALGAMLYQMLTGQLPFKGDNPGAVMLAHLQTAPQDPRLLVPDLSPQAAEAILCALAKDPQQRFPTAGALAQAAFS